MSFRVAGSAIGCGALACAILVANNLRDIPTDEVGRQVDPRGPARGPADPAALRGAGLHGVRHGRADRVEHLVVIVALGTALPALRPTLGVLYGAKGRSSCRCQGTGLLLLVPGVALGITLALS